MLGGLRIDNGALVRHLKVNLERVRLKLGVLRVLEILEEGRRRGEAVELVCVLEVRGRGLRGRQMLQQGHPSALVEVLPLHRNEVGVGQVDRHFFCQLAVLI